MPIRGHLPTGCGGARVIMVVEGVWWWNVMGGEVLVGPERSAVHSLIASDSTTM